MKPSRPPLPAILLPVGALLLSFVNGAICDHHDSPSIPDVSILRIHSELPPLDHAQVAGRSTRIVRGTVRSVTPFLFREGWKGAGPSRQSFVVHGGRMGRTITAESPAPSIETGAEYVFYLQNARTDAAILTAGHQSCGRVMQGRRGFRTVVLNGRERALTSL